MADTVDGEVRGVSGRVERMGIREKEQRLPGNSYWRANNNNFTLQKNNFGRKS